MLSKDVIDDVTEAVNAETAEGVICIVALGENKAQVITTGGYESYEMLVGLTVNLLKQNDIPLERFIDSLRAYSGIEILDASEEADHD